MRDHVWPGGLGGRYGLNATPYSTDPHSHSSSFHFVQRADDEGTKPAPKEAPRPFGFVKEAE